MSDISKLISIVFDKSESIEGKNLLTNTFSIKNDIFKIGGKNTNWTWANFFILQDTVDINQCKITSGQFYIQEKNGIWYLYDHKANVLISGIEKIKDFVGKTVQNETERIANILGIKIPVAKKYGFSKGPLQKIVYGAPGTGKSFSTDGKIHDTYEKGSTEEMEHVFRTTFHPDSDYSTFVGCYKPTKEKSADYKSKLLSKEELVERLKEYRNLYEETQAQTQFGFDYYESLRFRSDTNEILKQAAGKTFDTCIRVGMAIAERSTPKSSGNITYDFVPQSFTKAYIKAWEEILLAEYGKKDEEQKVNLLPTENDEAKKVMAKPVFLVIEEINRGNCAQIFGDLFQLLDRNEYGMSCYPIKPDTDLGNYIAGELRKYAQEHNINIDACCYKEIINGEEMLLPNNLYIWATMNTSDQSLFPIDSAFKRRWDWEYVPIEDADKKHYIKVGNRKYDWWTFIDTINGSIDKITGSEDKKMGYWFVKPQNKDRKITAKQFVSKVLFYLWNDVYKDFYDSSQSIFKVKNPDGSDEKKSFTYFFGSEAESRIQAFMEYNKIPYFIEEAAGNSDDSNAEDPDADSNLIVNSETKNKRHNLWMLFNQLMKSNNRTEATREAPTSSNYDISFRGAGAYIRNTVHVVANQNSPSSVYCELFFKPNAQSLYEFFEPRKEELSALLGGTIVWRISNGNNIGKIERVTNFDNETDRNEGMEWLATTSAKVYDFMKPIIEENK